MKATERLYLTADKTRVVREGDPEAAFLWANAGDEVPDSAAERFGLGEKRHKAAEDKRLEGGGDKQAKAGGDKDAAPGEGSGPGPRAGSEGAGPGRSGGFHILGRRGPSTGSGE